MRLLSAVLGFLMKKLGLFVGMVLVLFIGYVFLHAAVPTLREAFADRDRLPQVAAQRVALEGELEGLKRTAAEAQQKSVTSLEQKVSAEIEAGRRNVTQQQAQIQRLRKNQDEVCGFVQDLIDLLTPGSACDSAKLAVKKADEALTTLEASLTQAQGVAAVLNDPALSNQEKLARLGEGSTDDLTQREITNKQAELDQKKAEEKSLQQAQESVAGQAATLWDRSWAWLATIALLALLLPPLVRVVSYFVLMPVVRRMHKPLRLAAGSENADTELRTTPAERTLTIGLAPGEVLSARSEHVRPVQGKVRSQLLYDWKAPFISFGSGLHSLSRVTGDDRGSSATLATPDDPNSYLMRIDFADHPGLVMQPKYVVGVLGNPTLQTRWHWGIQALANWQVRYILFVGSGSLIVQGCGDVVATNPQGGSTRIEQNLVMGFDSRLSRGVNRTEVFWPYLRKKTPLVDDEFTGGHPLFWQKSSTAGPSNPIAKTFDALFSALGKLLGF